MFSARFQMILKGNLEGYEKAVLAANTSAIRTVVNRMRAQGRRQIERAGLGKRLPNSLRGEIRTPAGVDITRTGVSADPRGRVFSRAAGGKSKVDLIEVFEHGVTIQGHPFLAIPTAVAGGRRAKSPEAYPAGTFRYVPIKKKKGRPKANTAVAVLVHKLRKEVWYTLLPSVKLAKRLNLTALYARQLASLPNVLARAYERQFKRLGVTGATIRVRAS